MSRKIVERLFVAGCVASVMVGSAMAVCFLLSPLDEGLLEAMRWVAAVGVLLCAVVIPATGWAYLWLERDDRENGHL